MSAYYYYLQGHINDLLAVTMGKHSDVYAEERICAARLL